MKMQVIRIERVKRSGKSKSTGNDYNLDFTNITVHVSANKPDIFGYIEKTYQYKTSDAFQPLEQFRNKLPVELDLTIGVGLDAYNNPTEIIEDIKPLGSK